LELRLEGGNSQLRITNAARRTNVCSCIMLIYNLFLCGRMSLPAMGLLTHIRYLHGINTKTTDGCMLKLHFHTCSLNQVLCTPSAYVQRAVSSSLPFGSLPLGLTLTAASISVSSASVVISAGSVHDVQFICQACKVFRLLMLIFRNWTLRGRFVM
jgi:hypothetical protein